ncbi:MAG: AraC family transcriptional regulator [Anaerovoracaceae bacterium]
MLKEKIAYKDGLPVNLLVAEIDEYPIHFHEELEVVYVLKGRIKLRNGYYNYELKQGDIFILNDREIHSFERIDDEDNIVMMLQLDLGYFSAYYKNLKNCFFVTDMEDDDDESLEVLRGLLSKIMITILRKGYRYEQKVIEDTHNLIACLQSDFQYFLMEDGKFVNETKKKGNKVLAGRLNRITVYMYDNYYRKLTLNEIAEREHLSIYYLSHVIKEATGLSFQDLLSFIRVEESEKLLLGTKKKIGVISSETGFSAVRYYIKHFQRWYGMHPQEYRKKYTGKIISRESAARMRRCSPQEIEDAIRSRVQGIYTEQDNRHASAPVIVDLNMNGEEQNEGRAFIDELMIKPMLKPVAGPYVLIKSLGERVIKAGENYLVTTSCAPREEVTSLSILVYNYDRVMGRSLDRADRLQTVSELIKNYNESMEFLFRCSGLSGEFKICRYRVSKENSVMTFRRLLEKGVEKSEREILVRKWASLPSVEFGESKAGDTLSLRITMYGFSAELILLEKKETSD